MDSSQLFACSFITSSLWLSSLSFSGLSSSINWGQILCTESLKHNILGLRTWSQVLVSGPYTSCVSMFWFMLSTVIVVFPPRVRGVWRSLSPLTRLVGTQSNNSLYVVGSKSKYYWVSPGAPNIPFCPLQFKSLSATRSSARYLDLSARSTQQWAELATHPLKSYPLYFQLQDIFWYW